MLSGNVQIQVSYCKKIIQGFITCEEICYVWSQSVIHAVRQQWFFADLIAELSTSLFLFYPVVKNIKLILDTYMVLFICVSPEWASCMICDLQVTSVPNGL